MVGKSEIGYVTKLLSGSYFGEYSLFKQNNAFDFTAEVETSTLVLSLSEFKMWIKRCEFNYYSFALISYKRHLYFEKEFAKMFTTQENNNITLENGDENNEDQELFNDDLLPDEEEEFNELLEKIKEPEPTGCTAEEKEELIKKINLQAVEIEKLQKLYETDIKKIIQAIDLMSSGQEKEAFEMLTEI